EHRVGVDRRLHGHIAEAGDAGVRELAVDDDAPRRARRVGLRRVVAKETVDLREPGDQLRAVALLGLRSGGKHQRTHNRRGQSNAQDAKAEKTRSIRAGLAASAFWSLTRNASHRA